MASQRHPARQLSTAGLNPPWAWCTGSTCLRQPSTGHPRPFAVACRSASRSSARAPSRRSASRCCYAAAVLRSAPCRLSRQSAHHSQQGGPCLTACGGYCVMARHGFARNSPWTLVGSSVEDSATSVTMQLTKETLRCGKRISFAMPFCTKNSHFTKTGSGQTYGKHSKRDAFFVGRRKRSPSARYVGRLYALTAVFTHECNEWNAAARTYQQLLPFSHSCSYGDAA